MNNTQFATIGCNAIVMMAVMTIGGAQSLRAAVRPAPGQAPGEERRWALDFRTRLEQPGNARPVEIDISGDWVSTISAVRPGEYDAALRLENARFETAATTATANQSETLRRRLERPFWATYRDDGLLLTVHFYRDMDPTDRNLLQMIATECQFVQGSPDRSSWTVSERDGAGEYQAEYHRSNADVVTKHKIGYAHADGSIQVGIDRSELRFTLDADDGIVALDAINGVRMGIVAGNAGQLTAVTETHLSGLRKSQTQEMIGSLARALPAIVTTPVRTYQQDPAQLRAHLDAQLLEGRSTESILYSKAEDTLLPERLAALFRQRPEAASAALDILRKSGPHKPITDALGSAGSPAAIEALTAIARDRTLSRPLRIDALSAFILMQHPSVEAMRAPAPVLNEDDFAIATAARIVSGALARAGRSAHPEEANSIDAALVTRYRNAHELSELTGLLAAMGNSAGDSVVPVIERAMHDQRDAVRVAAARALRFVNGPEIEGLLAATILNDRDPGVRLAAIFATGFRHSIGSQLGNALVSATKADPAEQVRVSAINLLHQHPGVAPHFAETLAWIAQHDPKPSVRQLAAEIKDK